MSYTVWRNGVLLGRTDLAMPSAGSTYRAGQLESTAEFERAWPECAPTVEAFIAAGLAVGSAVADMPPPAAGTDPAVRGRQVYDRLSAHPGAARLRAASEALASLGLELRDATGGLVPTEFVLIQEVRPPAWVSAEVIAREVEEARRAGLEIRVPAYIITVRDASGTMGAGSPSKPPA